MNNAPSQGSPGAPHLSFSNPSSGIMPRRSSYASVAAGISTSPHSTPAASVQLPRPYTPHAPQHASNEQPSRITHSTSDPDAQVEGGISIPGSWGAGTSSFPNYMSPRYPGHSYGAPWREGSHGEFFKPTYLRDSKYIEKLEAAHKAKVAAQREEPAPRSSNTGALSTSSSTVSLQKMTPSHRGMTYDIIENEPQIEDEGPTPLPSKWADKDRWNTLDIGADGLEVRYVGQSKLADHEAAAVRSDHPMPSQCGIYYFEVSIISKGKDGMIGVGFSGSKASLEKLPGWEPDSWAYHGDDGKSFCCQLTGKSYSETFTSGDIIGCGVNFMTRCAFFTKNGHFLGNAFRDIKPIKLYPSVGMKRPHAHLTANFGQRPFVFDIDGMMARERQGIIDEINSADVSNLHPTLAKDDLCKALVAQYLSHDGYVETAKAFASEVRAEHTALRGSSESPLDGYLAVEEDHDSARRQQIRTAILDGDVDEALKLTMNFYQTVLPNNPQLLFRLRVRKFIEMMRRSTEFIDASTEKRSKSSNGHTMGPSDDGFDREMDLDEPLKGNEDWDKMETEEADNGLKHQDLLKEMVYYGQELKQMFKEDHSKLVTDTMTEIFGMFAYPDPRKSDQARLLDTSQRTPVAEALNSAILVSLGKPSSTAVERLYKQTVVLIDLISEDGGPGSFINVRDLLQGGARSW